MQLIGQIQVKKAERRKQMTKLTDLFRFFGNLIISTVTNWYDLSLERVISRTSNIECGKLALEYPKALLQVC